MPDSLEAMDYRARLGINATMASRAFDYDLPLVRAITARARTAFRVRDQHPQ